MLLFLSALSLSLTHASVRAKDADKNASQNVTIHLGLEQVLEDETPLGLGVSPQHSSLLNPDDGRLSGVSDVLPPLDVPKTALKKRSSRRSVPAPQ
jgi:hypothetical protein